MTIQLTNEASAALLGLNPAYYSEEYAAACRELDEASAELEAIDEESREYVKEFDLAWDRYSAAYKAWDELHSELSVVV